MSKEWRNLIADATFTHSELHFYESHVGNTMTGSIRVSLSPSLSLLLL